jgi:transcriptional enhancer factor
LIPKDDSTQQNNENHRHLATSNPHHNIYSNHNHIQHLQSHHPHYLNNTNQISPDLSPNNQQWPSITGYNGTTTTTATNRSIMGVHQLRLVEFSGFLLQRRDPDLYHKHLFVHLNNNNSSSNELSENSAKNEDIPPITTTTTTNTSTEVTTTGTTTSTTTTNTPSTAQSFETINYKEFADKFPESDFHLLLNNKPINKNGDYNNNSALNSFYLVKFWVDLSYNLEENASSVYAVTNIFESSESMTISCSTKVCSFGNQVVEKVETENARYESNGRYIYHIENSPMCEYMITFINKLKQLPDKSLKNSVLENFSISQVNLNLNSIFFSNYICLN